MMGKLGLWELLLIFAALLLLFGATRLPQLGASLGSAIRNFKRGFSGEGEPPADEKKPQELSGSSSTRQGETTAKVGSRDG